MKFFLDIWTLSSLHISYLLQDKRYTISKLVCYGYFEKCTSFSKKEVLFDYENWDIILFLNFGKFQIYQLTKSMIKMREDLKNIKDYR